MAPRSRRRLFGGTAAFAAAAVLAFSAAAFAHRASHIAAGPKAPRRSRPCAGAGSLPSRHRPLANAAVPCRWRTPGHTSRTAAAHRAAAAESASNGAGPAVLAPEPFSAGRVAGAAAIGAAAGFLGGALGLGGGFLVVPALTSLLNVNPRISIGTSACVVLAVSCVACPNYLQRGLASPRASLYIALAALVTARVGALLTNKVKAKTLKRMFGGWLLIVSSLIGAKAAGLMVASSVPGAGEAAAAPALLGLGAATGLVSGLLGVGGGTVLVPSLTLNFQFAQQEAQGCALLGMVLPSMVSVWTHWRRSNVDKALAGGAVLGALVGGWSGSLLATSLCDKTLRAIFSVVLGLVGVKYLRS